MKRIPETENALVLRTDFSDEQAWQSICEAIEEPVDEFQAYVEFVSDPAFANITTAEAISRMKPGSTRWYFFIVDKTTLSHDDRPVLVVDWRSSPGARFA